MKMLVNEKVRGNGIDYTLLISWLTWGSLDSLGFKKKKKWIPFDASHIQAYCKIAWRLTSTLKFLMLYQNQCDSNEF